ncbi:Reverse transcriptase [Theobroma cacao]|nr:Reverse transcriptase [Theobroma cacao]
MLEKKPSIRDMFMQFMTKTDAFITKSDAFMTKTDAIIQSQVESIRNLKTQVGQVASAIYNKPQDNEDKVDQGNTSSNQVQDEEIKQEEEIFTSPQVKPFVPFIPFLDIVDELPMRFQQGLTCPFGVLVEVRVKQKNQQDRYYGILVAVPSPTITPLTVKGLLPVNAYISFIASLDFISIPEIVHEALSHLSWLAGMVKEMVALDSNAGLVATGYARIYNVDYFDTFSPITKLTSIRLFISMAATYNLPLHQLDIKNTFLHGDLQKGIYMEQPLGFVTQGEYGKVYHLRKSLYGLKQSHRAWLGRCSQFQTKDLEVLKFFLGVVVTMSKKGIFLSQRKYVLDLLEETKKLGAKSCSAPMTLNLQLAKEDGELFEDPKKYAKLVGKLNYLTMTHLDIAYIVSVLIGEVSLKSLVPAKLWCDNQVAFHIASNLVFHE